MAYALRLKWRIEGVTELGRILHKMQRKVTDFKEPLWKSSKLVLADIERNFDTEGSLVGGWKKLAPSTVAGRIRAGYGGEHPILQRTGALKRSFYAYVDSKKAIVSSKGIHYYKYHQSRLPRTNLPRRAMLVLTKQTRENIQRVFNEFLRY